MQTDLSKIWLGFKKCFNFQQKYRIVAVDWSHVDVVVIVTFTFDNLIFCIPITFNQVAYNM